MPIYEYQCAACKAHHETIQKMSEAPLRKCPACGKLRLKRLISAPVFRLKGGGWYETDFKSDAEAKRNLHAEEKAQKPDAADKPATPAKEGAADAAPKSEAKGEASVASAPATKAASEKGPPKAPAKAGKAARRPRPAGRSRRR